MLTPEVRDWLRQDWCRFPKHVLGVDHWSGQQEVIRSVQRHKKTVVASGHKVGKTHVVGSLVPTVLLLHPNSRVITTANTGQQVRQNVWGEIHSQVRASKIPLGGHMNLVEWKLGPLWEAVGLSTNSPDSFQGKHAPGGTFVIFDECQDIPISIWQAAKSMIQGPFSRWLAIANPTKVSGPFFDACHDPSWNLVTLSCLDHPNIVQGRQVMPGVTLDFLEQYEEGSPEWFARVLGQFPEEDDYALITLRLLKNAASSRPAEEPIHIGVDIARYGGDENVMLTMKDRKVADVQAWRGADLMKTTGRIVRHVAEQGADWQNVHIDVIGLGAGVVDRLREMGHPVDAVNFAESPVGDWRGLFTTREDKFRNRRAELYWVCRELLRQGQLAIPEDFRRLHVDLTAPTYSWDSSGHVVVEPKDKIKARLGRSPDHGDALVIALSRAGNRRPRLSYV